MTGQDTDSVRVRHLHESELAKLGETLRARRSELGLSIRALARTSGVSSSYIGSLEVARNPTTGKAAAPSLRTLTALSEALDLELAELLQSIAVDSGTHPGHEHTLMYIIGDRPRSALGPIAALHPAGVDRWIYIPDPREPRHDTPPEVRDLTVVRWDWRLGSDPYPDRVLQPSRLLDRLELELRRTKRRIRAGERVGLVIADCSAVMRWVENPQDEVEFEARWPGEVRRIFDDVLARPPAANVCVYYHDDLEAMAMDTDVLAATLKLLAHHSRVAVRTAGGQLQTGRTAAHTLLRELKPRGVSTAAWRELTRAAARTVIGAADETAPTLA